MAVDLYIDEEGQLHFYKLDSTPTKPMQRIGIAYLQLNLAEVNFDMLLPDKEPEKEPDWPPAQSRD